MTLYLLAWWLVLQEDSYWIISSSEWQIWMKEMYWWKPEIYETMFHPVFCAIPLQFRHPLGFIYYDSRMQFVYSPNRKKLLLFFLWYCEVESSDMHTEVCMIIIFWRCHYYRPFIFHRHLCGCYKCSHDNEPLVEPEEKKEINWSGDRWILLITKRFVGRNAEQKLILTYFEKKHMANENNISEYSVPYTSQLNCVNVIWYSLQSVIQIISFHFVYVMYLWKQIQRC